VTPVEAELTAREGRPVRQVRDFGELTTPGQIVWGDCTCGQKHRMMLRVRIVWFGVPSWTVFDRPERCAKVVAAKDRGKIPMMLVDAEDVECGGIYRVVDIAAPFDRSAARLRQNRRAKVRT
jgi:hypothetical protein